MEAIVKVILGSLSVGTVIMVLARIIPNDKVRAAGVSSGLFISVLGMKRFGRRTWEKIEDFLENSVGVFLVGLKAGLDQDDGPTDTATKGTRVSHPPIGAVSHPPAV